VKRLFCIFLLAAASLAQAGDISCTGCTAAQFSSRALAAGYGQHRVYDLNAGIIRGYSVTCSNEVVNGGPQTQSIPGACPANGALVIEEVGIDNLTLQAFQAVRTFYIANGYALGHTVVDLRDGSPSSGGRTVYEFLGSYPERQALYDWLRTGYSNNHILQQYSTAIAHSLLAALQILPSNAFIVEIIFQDGSKISVKFKAEDSTFEIVPDSARDPDGVAIPQSNQSQYQGQYNFASGHARDQFIRHLISLGIAVGRGTGNRVSCTWDPVNLTLRCVPG